MAGTLELVVTVSVLADADHEIARAPLHPKLRKILDTIAFADAESTVPDLFGVLTGQAFSAASVPRSIGREAAADPSARTPDELIGILIGSGLAPNDFWPARASLEIARQLERLEATIRTAAVEAREAKPRALDDLTRELAHWRAIAALRERICDVARELLASIPRSGRRILGDRLPGMTFAISGGLLADLDAARAELDAYKAPVPAGRRGDTMPEEPGKA
jgi:hypothetical protein